MSNKQKKKANKTVRRLIDYDDLKQYKILKSIAKDKGYTTLKKYIQFILRNEVIKYENKQLELFKKSEK